MKGESIRIGALGAGGFGLFALQQFTLRDQIRWIYNRNHHRKLTEENGRESLVMAVEATRLADEAEKGYNVKRVKTLEHETA